MNLSASQLKRHVVDLLSDVPAGVAFEDVVGGLRVGPKGFKSVATEIDRWFGLGKVSVQQVNGPYLQGFAQYDLGSNSLQFAPDYNPADLYHRSAVVHEAVHALQDKHQRVYEWPAHELASFVTQALYVRLAGAKATGGPKSLAGTVDQSRFNTAYLEAADAVAGRLAGDNGAGKLSLKDADVKHLLKQLKAKALYGTKNSKTGATKATGDGWAKK